MRGLGLCLGTPSRKQGGDPKVATPRILRERSDYYFPFFTLIVSTTEVSFCCRAIFTGMKRPLRASRPIFRSAISNHLLPDACCVSGHRNGVEEVDPILEMSRAGSNSDKDDS